MHQVFKYGRNWKVVLDALRTDLTCPLANVFATDYFIAREDIQSALLCLKRAKATRKLYGPKLTEREALYISAYDAWLSGKPNVALAHFMSIIRLKPQDLFAAKRAQLMAFILGDARTMLAVLTSPPVEAACRNRPYYHGMLSFALEQNHMLEDAYIAARRGVEICPEDPWAHHAVAHTLYFQGRLRSGLNFMLSAAANWNNCMSFMLTHNWFHIALFYIDLNDFARTLIAFDHGIWRHPELEKIEPEYTVSTVVLKLRAPEDEGSERVPDVIPFAEALQVADMHQKYLASKAHTAYRPIVVAKETDGEVVETPEHLTSVTRGENGLLPPALLTPQALMKSQDKDYSQDFLGAVGLLWKLEIRMNAANGVRADTQFVQQLLRDTLRFEDRLASQGSNSSVAYPTSARAPKHSTLSVANSSSLSTSGSTNPRMNPSIPHTLSPVAASTLFGIAMEHGSLSDLERKTNSLAAILPVPTKREPSVNKATASPFKPPLLHSLRIPALDSRWHDISLHAKVPSTHADPFCDIMTGFALGRAGLIQPLHEHVLSARKATLAIPVRKRRAQLMLSLIPMLEAVLAFHRHDFELARAWLVPVFGLYPVGHAPLTPYETLVRRVGRGKGVEAPKPRANPPQTEASAEDGFIADVLGDGNETTRVAPPQNEDNEQTGTWDMYMSITKTTGNRTAESQNEAWRSTHLSSVDSHRYYTPDMIAHYAAEAGSSLPERIQAVGGSSEQREVFSEFYLEVLFALGDLEEILRVLDRKIRLRPIPYLHLLRTQAYSLLQKQAEYAHDIVTKGYAVPRTLNGQILRDDSAKLSSIHGVEVSLSANEAMEPSGTPKLAGEGSLNRSQL